jgi:hypothetical protein
MLEEDAGLKAGVAGKFSEAVNRAIYDAARGALERKGSSLQDDERLLEAPGMIRSQRHLLALRFRVSQKRILQRAIDLAKKRSSGL